MFTYEEAVAYIEEIPKFTTKNKLEHTRKCLDRLGSPDQNRKQEPMGREAFVPFCLLCWKKVDTVAVCLRLLIW